MRFYDKISLGKRARLTLDRGVLGDPQGSDGIAVNEYQGRASPSMRVRDFNIDAVAWSNFKSGIIIIERIAIFDYSASIDVVNVEGGVDVAPEGMGGRKGRELPRASGAVLRFRAVGMTGEGVGFEG